MRLTEQQDQIGLGQHVGECAKPRVVDATWTLHPDRGHAGRGGEPAQQRVPGCGAKHGTGQDQRPLRICQRRQRNIGRGLAQRAYLGSESGCIRPQGGAVLNRLIEKIGRQTEVDGPWAS